MPEVKPSPHPPHHTDDSVLWWVQLCRWLWKLVTLVGISVVLSLAASLIASWLTSPHGHLPSTSPFAWLLAYWFVVLPVGLCFLLLAVLIGVLSRWPSSVKHEGESNVQTKKVAAPPEAAVFPFPSTTTQHLSGDSPLQPTIPTDEVDLPTPSFFIGRKLEQDWLAERLHRGGPSAISAICGLGGIGKTSLVAWSVQQLRKRNPTCFPDGIAVVFCENQTSAEEVLRGIVERFAPALVQPQTANQEQFRILVRRLLLGKDALVILDNIEPQLAIEQVMVPLRAACVHVILTARQRLPFAVAPPEATKVLDLLSPNEALDVFACCLGYSSARQLSAKARRASKRIITVLDNHPLAITLAGAYAAQLHIDLAELADQLADPQRALDLPQDEVPQAVRKMFSHSIQQLPDTAQRLFAGLAVFAQRDFGHQAAIALATALSPQTARHDIDMLLRRLLVGRTQNARMAEISDRTRLHLHPLLHALARSLFQQWSSEEQDQAHRAVASYYATYANQLATQFAAAVSQQTTVDEAAFLADEENMTNKLDWALKQPQENVLVADLCLVQRHQR
jgi:NB-ARC domain